MGKGKDKFCPFMSKERKDGLINKVDCDKNCALFIDGYGCGLIRQSMVTNNTLGTVEILLREIRDKNLKGS